MAEFAPLFDGAVIPKNTTKMASRTTKDALVSTTVGAAAGTNTVSSKARIKHPSPGVREFAPAIEANPAEINRNSTAADVTAMKSQLGDRRPSFTFPRDLSGNGGPAFTRS